MQGYRDLGQTEVTEARLDRHLGGKFHPGAALIQAGVKIASEAAHSAMHVVKGRSKPHARKPREHRISPPAVQERHCLWQYLSAAGAEPAAHHEIVALAQLTDESGHFVKVVA